MNAAWVPWSQDEQGYLVFTGPRGTVRITEVGFEACVDGVPEVVEWSSIKGFAVNAPTMSRRRYRFWRVFNELVGANAQFQDPDIWVGVSSVRVLDDGWLWELGDPPRPYSKAAEIAPDTVNDVVRETHDLSLLGTPGLAFDLYEVSRRAYPWTRILPMRRMRSAVRDRMRELGYVSAEPEAS